MKLGCEVCQLLVDSVAEWINHLAGEQHQKQSHQRTWQTVPLRDNSVSTKDRVYVPAFMKWDQEHKERSIVLNEFKHILTDRMEILKHVTAFGFVTDFICDPDNYYAVVQYDEKASAEQLVKPNNTGFINGRILRLRLMTHVSQLEWVISLNIDAKYDKYDQEFFIRHLETMSEICGQDIDQQFHGWLVRTSVDGNGILVRQTILRDLGFIIRQSFPKAYMYPMQPLLEGVEDVDGVFEIYMDPFASCGSSVAPPQTPDFAQPEFQMAIIRILYILQNQTVLPGCEKYCSEVTVHPTNVVLGTSPGHLIRGINFHHRSSGTHCRLCFDGVMTSNVSALVIFLMTLDARVLPFLRFIHYWARIHRLTRYHPEMNQVLTMMAYVYLIRKTILPSVWNLQQLARVPNSSHEIPNQRHFFVEGWDVSFTKDPHQADAYMMSRGKRPFEPDTLLEGPSEKYKSTLGKHGTRVLLIALFEFFEAFATLDWRDYVMSPFMGDLLPRSSFEPGQEANLPAGLNLYKLRAFSNHFNLSNPMIVQHPFNLSLNIAEGMDDMFYTEFKTVMKETACRIKETLNSQDILQLSNVFPKIESLLKMERNESPQAPISPPCATPDSGSISMPDLRSQDGHSSPLGGSVSSGNTLTYSLVAKKAAQNVQTSSGNDQTLTQPKNTSGNTSGHTVTASGDSNSLSVKLMKFEVNKRFKETFLAACQGLGTDYRVKDRLKTLAIVFMRDFAWSLWGRCYYLHAVPEKVPDTEPQFHIINRMFEARFPPSGNSVMNINKSPDSSDISNISDIPEGEDLWASESCGSFDDVHGEQESFREDQWEEEHSDEDDHNTDPWHRITRKDAHVNEYTLFGKDKKRTTSATSDKSAVSTSVLSVKEKAEELRIRFSKIPKSACKNYCQIIKLHGYQKIWTNRRGVRAAMSLHQKMNNKQQQIPTKDSPEKSSSDGSFDGSATILINPLDKEEAITRGVLEGVTGWGKTPSKRALWSLEATVRIDTSKDFPTLYMAIKEGKNPYVCHNMMNYFGNYFPQLFSEYMAYRLTKWIEGTSSSPRN